MNKYICTIKSKLRRWSSYITLIIPITFNNSIYRSNNNIMPNIKFPILIQQWLLNIFLYDICFKWTIWMPLFTFYYLFYCICFKMDCYTVSSICTLSWLYYPCAASINLFHFSLSLLFIKWYYKFRILLIVNTSCNMKCQRYHFI